ncbi:hypothetical protein SAMN05421688_0678 [Poseidonocella pacifica]|uniref:DUF6314 domain-containing protein n=1 Tax=Poseidonocella pacifica TaxID=871651 RepID=A0A1I0VIM6_9RHOB|nr:DUF6314 family protein [Poseidonocella pacifica]SFA76224.1 hypothetical protein SAMN05421688_0678 [Poseidonocella pacifica]
MGIQLAERNGLRTLYELEGKWRLARVILQRDGTQAHFIGTAAFLRNQDGLDYSETGKLHMPGQAAMKAERRYEYRQRGSAVEVFYPDGRPFHRFGLDDPYPYAAHLCGEDNYQVVYDFANLPNWTAEWHVRGPRKNYNLTSRYSLMD